MTLRRNGKPSSSVAGSIGDIYIDLNTGEKYECVYVYKDSMLNESYKWKLIGKEDVKVPTEQPKEEKPKVDDKPIDIPNESRVEQTPVQAEVVSEPEPKQRTNYHKQFKQK